MRVQVIGCGYVGLATALSLSSGGIPVTGVEIDREKRDAINSGTAPFHEPGISDLLHDCLKKGFEVKDSPTDSDISFIAVGTPSNDDGSINLSYLQSASKMLGTFLKGLGEYHTVVVKSTVVPGTTEGVVKPAIEASSGKKVGKEIGLCMNPEFLREGLALQDMMAPDRVVIGEYDVRSGEGLASLYDSFYKKGMPPLIRTSIVNAELIKYASNSFLATKISFINTIANIAQRIPGADISTVAKGMGYDQRIGAKFLSAGLGYGGSCFPKDVKALISFARGTGYNPLLLEDVEDVNLRQFEGALGLARKAIGGFGGKVVTLLGLSFKPDTDDVREAVSERMIGKLLSEGAMIRAYDPVASASMARKFPDDGRIVYAKTAVEALDGSDCCFLVTEWDEFRKLGPDDFLKEMRTPVLIDGRRIYDPKEFSGRMKAFFAIGLGAGESSRSHVNIWRDPALAVNAIMSDPSGQVYLVRRNKSPFRGALSLPGGFVDYNESVERTISRELREEVGVTVTGSELLGVYSDPLRSPDKHVVALLYKVKYEGLPQVLDREELSEGRFYDAKKIPEELAFDHSKMLRDYLSRTGGA